MALPRPLKLILIPALLLLTAGSPPPRLVGEVRDPYTGERAYEVAGEYFSLTVPVADLEFAQKVLGWLEDARESLQKEFSLPLDATFRVRITRLIPQEPPAVVGLYKPAERAILVRSPRAWTFPVRQMHLKSTILHEFVHAAGHQVLDEYYAFLPVWLNEGMAEHMGAYRDDLEWNVREHSAFLSAIHLRSPPSLERLEEDFKERARAAVAYPAAKTLVEYILSRWGRESAGEILLSFRDQRPGKEALERAFESLYGLSLKELERDWQEAIIEKYSTLAEADAHLQAGREHYQEARWAEAAREAELAAGLDPMNLRAFILQMNAYGKVRELEQALKAARRAAELDPEGARIQSQLGYLLVELKRPEEAIHPLKQALELNPEDVLARHDLSQAYYLTGQIGPALEVIREAVELEPKNAALRNQYGFLLGEEGRYRESLEQLLRGTELDPRSASLRVNLAWVYDKLGKTERAIEHARRATELDRRNAGAWNWLGTLLALEGKVGEAEKSLRQAMSLAPRLKNPYYVLAGLYEQGGRWEEARSLYRKLLLHYPREQHAKKRLKLLRARP